MTFKFQQGGAAPQQDLQQQVVQLVQAAMQGDAKAREQVQQIMDAAQKGDQQAMEVAQMIQETVKSMQGQARRQQIGGKLDYIHKLRTGVNPDEEVLFERCGGKVVKKVAKKCNGGKSMQKPKAEAGCAMKPVTYFKEKGGKAVMAKKCFFGGSL